MCYRVSFPLRLLPLPSQPSLVRLDHQRENKEKRRHCSLQKAIEIDRKVREEQPRAGGQLRVPRENNDKEIVFVAQVGCEPSGWDFGEVEKQVGNVWESEVDLPGARKLII